MKRLPVFLALLLLMAGPFLGAGVSLAQDGVVTLENVVIPAGQITYRINSARVTGTALSEAELLAILEPGAPATVRERLEKLTFAEAVVAEFTVETAMAGTLNRTTYRNIRFLDVVAGKAGRVQFDGATLSVIPAANGTPAPLTGSVGASFVERLNIPGMLRAFGDTSDNDSAPMETLYAAYTIGPFRLEGTVPDGAIAMSIDRLAGANFRGRPGKIGFLPLMALIQRNPDAKLMTPEDKQTIFTGLVQFFRNFDYGSLEVDNVSMSLRISPAAAARPVPDGKSAPKSVDMKMASMRFGIADANFRLEGLEMGIPDDAISVKLGLYEIKGYSLTPTLDALYELLQTTDISDLDMAKLDFRDFMPVLGRVTLRNISMEGPDKDGTFGGRMKFGIGETNQAWGNQIRGIPTSLVYTIGNVTIDLPENSKEEAFVFLRANGLRKLDFSASLVAKWNEETKEFGLSELSVSGDKLGSVKVSAAIGNMSREFFSVPPSTVQMLALALTAKSAEIQAQNAGLLEMGLKMAARKAAKPEAAIRKDIVEAVKQELSKSMAGTPAQAAIVDGVSRFLQGGKSLTIGVKAKNGFGIGAMDFVTATNPKDVLNKIDVQVQVR